MSTEPISTPGIVSALGQALADQTNRLANETARPTLADPTGMRLMVEAIKEDLGRLDDVLAELIPKPHLASLAQFVLWGFHPAHRDGEVAILAGGTFGACEEARKEWDRHAGWTIELLPAGEDPTELRDKARQAKGKPTDEFILWGFHAEYADGEPIKIAGGSFRACEREWKIRFDEGGWTMAIVGGGDEPTELRAKARKAKEGTTDGQ